MTDAIAVPAPTGSGWPDRLRERLHDLVGSILQMADIWTDAGEELLVDILDTTVVVPTWFIGWGTGAGTAAKGDTTLFTEASETRIAATLSQPAVNQSRYVATITADGTKTITNAGILSLVTGGVLWAHWDHGGVAVDASDAIEYTVTITWA